MRRVLWQRAREHGRRDRRRRLERHAAMRPDPMIDSAFESAEGPGVVPETILPEQFFRPSAALPPEKRLMLAVLEGALLDLQRSAGARTPRARRLRDEVDAWFAADGEDWPFSFVNLCYALGLDAFAGPAAASLSLLATAAILVAAQSGEDAHVAVEAVPGAARAVRAHQEWGERTRNLAVGVGALELLALSLRGRPNARRIAFASAGVGLAAFLSILETGKLGGELVYAHAGGVGIRSGDPEDVARLLLAGLYQEAELDEKAGRAADAASLLEIAAQRFPADPTVQVRAAEALLEERNDPAGALEILGRLGPI